MSRELTDWLRKGLKRHVVTAQEPTEGADSNGRDGRVLTGSTVQLLKYRVHQYPNDQDGTLWLDIADKSCFAVARIAPEAWTSDSKMAAGIVKYLGGLFVIKRFNIIYTPVPIFPRNKKKGIVQVQTFTDPQICFDILELSLFGMPGMPDMPNGQNAADFNEFFAFKKKLRDDYNDSKRAPTAAQLLQDWGDFDITNLALFKPSDWPSPRLSGHKLSLSTTTQESIPNPSFEFSGTPDRMQPTQLPPTHKSPTTEERSHALQLTTGDVDMQQPQTQLPSTSTPAEGMIRESSYADFSNEDEDWVKRLNQVEEMEQASQGHGRRVEEEQSGRAGRVDSIALLRQKRKKHAFKGVPKAAEDAMPPVQPSGASADMAAVFPVTNETQREAKTGNWKESSFPLSSESDLSDHEKTRGRTPNKKRKLSQPQANEDSPAQMTGSDGIPEMQETQPQLKSILKVRSPSLEESCIQKQIEIEATGDLCRKRRAGSTLSDSGCSDDEVGRTKPGRKLKAKKTTAPQLLRTDRERSASHLNGPDALADSARTGQLPEAIVELQPAQKENNTRSRAKSKSCERSAATSEADTTFTRASKNLPFIDLDDLLSPPPEDQRGKRRSLFKQSSTPVTSETRLNEDVVALPPTELHLTEQTQSPKKVTVIKPPPIIDTPRTISWSTSPQVNHALPSNVSAESMHAEELHFSPEDERLEQEVVDEVADDEIISKNLDKGKGRAADFGGPGPGQAKLTETPEFATASAEQPHQISNGSERPPMRETSRLSTSGQPEGQQDCSQETLEPSAKGPQQGSSLIRQDASHISGMQIDGSMPEEDMAATQGPDASIDTPSEVYASVQAPSEAKTEPLDKPKVKKRIKLVLPPMVFRKKKVLPAVSTEEVELAHQHVAPSAAGKLFPISTRKTAPESKAGTSYADDGPTQRKNVARRGRGKTRGDDRRKPDAGS